MSAKIFLIVFLFLNIDAYSLPFSEVRSLKYPAVVPSYVPWEKGRAIFKGDSTKYGQHQTLFFINDTTAIMAGHGVKGIKDPGEKGVNDKGDWRNIYVLGERPIAIYKTTDYRKRANEQKNFLWWRYDADPSGFEMFEKASTRAPNEPKIIFDTK